MSPFFFQLKTMACQWLLFKCELFVFPSGALLWSPPFLVSLPSLFSENSWETYRHPGWLCLIPQSPFQSCHSFKEGTWKKLSIFWKMSILSVQFYATDSAYCKSFLTRCTVLGGWRKKRPEETLGSSVCVPQKSEQLLGDNETFNSD